MSESFSDLWASSNPVKSQQPQPKTLGAAVNSGLNAPRRPAPDAFNMLASAGSSQPNSRPITPSMRPSKLTPSNSGDAFGGLVSFGGTTSRDDGLTIAERAAKAERERREKAERDQAALKSQGSFWDQFEGQSKGPTKPVAPAKSNGAGWDVDFLTPEPTPPPAKPTQPAKSNGNAASWDLDFISSEPQVSVTPPTTQPSRDIFDIDDLATLGVTQPSRSKDPSRANTPGSFDFGDREDALLADGDEEEDDILGSLAKPVEAVRRASPIPAAKTPSPAPMRASPSRTSPPPHVLGRIVEMGFSIQQAKVALAATPTGLDVDAALEILLRNASEEHEEPDRERERDWEREREEAEAAAEAERKRKRRQGPSRATISPEGSSSSSSTQQQGLQDQADKLLAQASTIGLSMFTKANAFWKEGREKVVKAYEEQRSASAGADVGKGKGRPRWMDQAPTGEGEVSGFVDDDEDARPRETHSAPQKTRPVPPQPRSEPKISLFADEEEPIYKSPARRRPPPSKAPPSSAVPTLVPASAPPPITRLIVAASSSALASSNAHKATGTDHFKLGRFADADTAYSSAIAALPTSHLLRVPLHNNRALTRLKTGDYKGTVEDAGEVVSIITGEAGSAWHPGREAGDTAGLDLGDALGKALRRRAEAYEGLEKWKDAMADWERLSAAAWIGHVLRGDAVKGAGRCRRIIAGESTAASAPSSAPKSKPKPKPPRPSAVPTRPSEALSRVRAANTAQEAEDQERYDLKDDVDARLTAWRAGKETNLRALIASLDTVLWPALGWQKVGMAELVSPGQVKVRYTKAIAKLHPDKLNTNNTTLEQRMVANGVFGTLNEAWNAFR